MRSCKEFANSLRFNVLVCTYTSLICKSSTIGVSLFFSLISLCSPISALFSVYNFDVSFLCSLCGYEPFYAELETDMYEHIKNCRYEFHSPWWDNVSKNAQDLVRNLLVKDPKKRFTAQQALKHPWVVGNAAPPNHMEETQLKLKEFNAKRRLRVSC